MKIPDFVDENFKMEVKKLQRKAKELSAKRDKSSIDQKSFENSKNDKTINLRFLRQKKVFKTNYKYKETIDLNISKHKYYYSRNRLLLLMDDIFGVDIICLGQYFPEISKNQSMIPLQYVIGCDNEETLIKTKNLIENIVFSSEIEIRLEDNKVYNVFDGRKLTRIYLENFLKNINHEICKSIQAKLNDLKKGLDTKIQLRGQYSSFIEECFSEVSNESTYIQIISNEVLFYKKKCIEILNSI